jgi:serine/threonine protein kinase
LFKNANLFIMARSPASSAPNGEVAVPRPGEIIEGKYRVEKVLGEGGMAVVLAAHHELLDQRVAVKVLTATDERAISRFSFEAQSTARLKSEHVARVMDVGALPGGAPFMVMEYLEGCDLEELLKLHGSLPVEEAVGYVLQALEGLAQAHGLGIVHRDLKPANLFLAVHPSGASVIKVVDFGISKSIVSRRSGTTGSVTAEHSTVGSPAYMAPEQIRASRDVDPRADLWSLGVVLYELLCGQSPFPGESVGAIFAAVLEREAPEVSTRAPGVPASLSAAVARCLRRDAAERYPNALDLARDLAPFGPADARARVARIEQTLKAKGGRAEDRDPRTSSIRVSLGAGQARGEITAELTDTDSHESRSRILGRAALAMRVTAEHVAVSTDTPNPELAYRGETLPSLARRARRRTLVAVAGASGVAAFLVIAAILRSGAPIPGSHAPASVSATPLLVPAPASEPARLPGPADPASVPTPLAATAAVGPPAKAKPAPAVLRHPPSPASSSPKKHLGVLDSPD